MRGRSAAAPSPGRARRTPPARGMSSRWRARYPLLDEVDRGLRHRLVAGAADPGRDDRSLVVPGEAGVLLVDQCRAGRRAVGRRGGVVGHEHPRDPAEVLEHACLVLLPEPLPHVGGALRPEPVRVRQRHHDHVDPGLRAGEAVGERCGVAGPVDVRLRTRLVREPPGRPRLLRRPQEHLAERLVRVGGPPGRGGGLAVLRPEHLDREPAVAPLALDQGVHVGLQVGTLRRQGPPAAPVSPRPGRAHRGDVVEGERSLAQHSRARRYVALADVQRGRDLGL